MGGRQAILSDEWKAVRLNVGKDPNGPLELYNLESDPFEEKNVAEERLPSLKFNFGMKTISRE